MPYKDKEKRNEYAKKWYRKKKLDLKFLEKYRKYRREQSRKYKRELRRKIFELLGNMCANPFNLPHPTWCNDSRCLQIDHIHANGEKQQRGKTKGKHGCTKHLGFKGGYEQYLRKILREIQSGSKDYQLLCANCNWIKRSINKEV